MRDSTFGCKKWEESTKSRIHGRSRNKSEGGRRSKTGAKEGIMMKTISGEMMRGADERDDDDADDDETKVAAFWGGVRGGCEENRGVQGEEKFTTAAPVSPSQ